LRLVNFRAEGHTSCGALVAHGVLDLGARLGEPAVSVLSLLRAGLIGPARQLAESGNSDHSLQEVQLLNPAGRDTRYFCIGVNYPDRNEEYKDGTERPKYPSIFMRSHTSFSAPGEPIVRPRESEQLDYEGEIVVVIGEGGRRIPEGSALRHIAGFSCANEGSVRDWLRHSKFNVTQGKNFDRSGSIGPQIVTADEVGMEPLTLITRVNGEIRQHDRSDRMIFPIPYLISYLSRFCTLETGDVILTGTPSGAGARFDPPRYLVAGDVVEVEVERVGVLRNEVIADDG
jgi:2-keto-4-pentenoate hydratase/2-oxohepta-3-ene-1,7-dioic acid hydratase in catechol pathway